MTPLAIMIGWAVIGFFAGFWNGARCEARIWRGKGDHAYMNRMESGGNLYIVRRVDIEETKS